MTNKISLYKKISKSLFEWRSMSMPRLVQYIFMFSSIPMLAYGLQTYNLDIIKIIIFTIITLYSGFFATLIWNDITDKKIDAIVHPKRSIPAGRISTQKIFIIALIFSILTIIFSFLINYICLILVVIAALFVFSHNKYLRRKIKIPAYSEIFTPLQWIIVPIFGYFAINNSNYINMLILVLFTYFADASHDLPEGIHDADGDRILGIRTYTTSLGEYTSAKISFIMLFLSGIFGIMLYFNTILTLIFLIPFLLLWLYTLYYSYIFMTTNSKDMKKFGLLTGQKIFRFFWLTYDLIFINICILIIL